jgi:transcriptional regulator with XRE-family HTH domain
MGILSFAKAAEIRLLKGVKLQREVAEQFGVSESTISDVWLGRTWSKPKKIKEWTAEEDSRIKEAVNLGYNFPKIAEFVGRPVSAVMNRTYRLGLRSGQPLKKTVNHS